MELWRIKASIAKGRPFPAYQDIYGAALDIINGVAFAVPTTETIMTREITHLRTNPPPKIDGGEEAIFPFPSLPLDLEAQACIDVVDSISVAFRSPVPRLSHFLYRQTPHMRRVLKIKDNMIRRNIGKGLVRMEERVEGGKEREMRCAVDMILLREKAIAQKAGIKPDYYRPAIQGEVGLQIIISLPPRGRSFQAQLTPIQLFGYIVGGHDTTSTTLTWWVKFAAHAQHAQIRLRQALHEAFPNAVSSRTAPTVTDITRTQVPYLDAFIEETLRHSKTLPVTSRQPIANTQILGVPIPKGTTVMMISHGASILYPAIAVDEKKRTEAAKAAKDRYGVWDPENVREFLPERWLKVEKGADGVEGVVYDSTAGPQMAFGGGPRGCFGRRLAYLELRIAIALLTWNFEFGELSEELNHMAGKESLTTMPEVCYVNLRPVKY